MGFACFYMYHNDYFFTIDRQDQKKARAQDTFYYDATFEYLRQRNDENLSNISFILPNKTELILWRLNVIFLEFELAKKCFWKNFRRTRSARGTVEW